MTACLFCGNDVQPAYTGPGRPDMTLVTSTGNARCPAPAALRAPGVTVGQNPTHQTSPMQARE